MDRHIVPLTLEDVASRLGISYNQVRALLADGEIPYFRVGKRGIRIKEADLQAYLARKSQEATNNQD
jgi:excisionase family DNA binding protein